jgi:hypothetical protein
MKTLIILATITLTITSCKGKKETIVENKTVFPDKSVVTSGKVAVQQTEAPTIYYEATSRGVFLSIKVEKQTLYVSRNRDFKEYEDKIAISDADWKEISALANAVDLEKVKDLKWPTEKRYYDGAAHANIIFESKGVKYPANGFDHGFPPAEVEKLVNTITKLAETK